MFEIYTVLEALLKQNKNINVLSKLGMKLILYFK